MSRLQRTHNRFIGSRVIAESALLVVSLMCAAEFSWPVAAMISRTALSELPLTFPVQSPEIAAYFNQVARPQDVATFPLAFIHLLPQVTAGQKMVAFASWAEAEDELAALIGQIDMVAYNAEHWEQTPASEQQDLAATIQRAAEFAHAHRIQFMFAPDRLFAEEYVSQVAPYVDAILLQGQRLQHDPQAFASWVRDMSATARSSNPQVQIYAQVGATRGTAPQMLAAIQSVSNDIDGIAVWSMPRSLDILQEFVTVLRESAPTTELTPETAVATAVPKETIVQTYAPTVLPTAQTQSTKVEQDAQSRWLKEIALIAGGVVIGLLLGVGFGRRRYSQ